jgi:hypothetical protein
MAILKAAWNQGIQSNTLFSTDINEIEDKPWFYDKGFWDAYLTELATHRFNRFSLALGIGYDSGHDPGVVDNYFCFAYPFFLHVPGYNVRAANLPDAEAARNLEMLRYIGEQAKLRGLHFQLGLWTHSYAFPDSPSLRYKIEGVTPENHASYCRDALKALLEACPSIDGVTLRVHYESGIPEPASDFWHIVMEGAERSGQRIEIDMHAKGVDDELLQSAAESGSPILVSPKYWAEHLGLPYHQADIRPLEKPRQGRTALGFDALTAASRRFTRYGYGDFLKERRSYGVLFRVWPGTQRLLLWGDPAMAAGFGRFGTFCGSQGIEWFDPMSFKARKDSGSSGGRDTYADSTLGLNGHEWKKYRYTYRLWGRLMFNPEADPDGWRRFLRYSFGEAALDCESALAEASRILPLVTVAYHPSAANNIYWPEMYTNQGIVNGEGESDGSFDTPAPHTFGSAFPLDPQLFYRIDDYAKDQLSGELKGKYTPIDVSRRLDTMANAAEKHLLHAELQMSQTRRASPEFRRFRADVTALVHLGRFFSYKILAALTYAMYKRTKDSERLRQALQQYRMAREAWGHAAEATSVYKEDVTFGYKPYARGHWRDRIAEIDRDIAAMEREYAGMMPSTEREAGEAAAAAEMLHSGLVGVAPEGVTLKHVPEETVQSGKPLEIVVTSTDASKQVTLQLFYRIANQSLSYLETEMDREGDTFRASIPATVTEGGYPIVYYFVVREDNGAVRLWPGLEEHLSNQPYYVIRTSNEEESR